MIKVGINGFGRIGSLAFRAAIKSDDIEVVAINAPGHPASHIAYCVKYDSVHGRFDGEVVGNDEDSTVTVNGKVVKEKLLLTFGEMAQFGLKPMCVRNRGSSVTVIHLQ